MKTVLVVEDERHQRILYGRELADEGYQVVLAATGQEALQLVRDRCPDLIILDICMPGMDGIEALGRILRTQRSVPIILHTAYSSYRDNYLTWSADAYVVKSSNLTELKDTVRRLLSGADGDE